MYDCENTNVLDPAYFNYDLSILTNVHGVVITLVSVIIEMFTSTFVHTVSGNMTFSDTVVNLERNNYLAFYKSGYWNSDLFYFAFALGCVLNWIRCEYNFKLWDYNLNIMAAYSYLSIYLISVIYILVQKHLTSLGLSKSNNLWFYWTFLYFKDMSIAVQHLYLHNICF